jgi:putative colanic acid biosynthesis glycosyltransferase WcaI
MKILVVSCVFPPEPVTSASTSHALACELARQGNTVTVITSYPSRPGGQLFSGFRRHFLERNHAGNNFEIIRCFSTISRTATLLSRLAENLSFGFCSGFAMARMPRPDVIYANTWPIFAVGIAALVAKARRIPIVISVQDIYPESLISLKKIKPGGPVARMLKSFDTCIARAASALVVISERAEHIYSRERGIPHKQIHCIANWRPKRERPTVEMARQQRDIWRVKADTFLIVFAGSVVPACGLEVVIHAVSRLKDGPLAHLMIAGSGSDLDSCKRMVEQLQTGNVEFGGSFLEEQTFEILAAASILILPTQGDQSLVSMPSKLISYMMSGRPIVALACPESDLARVVNTSGCGWTVAPGDVDGLAQLIRTILPLESSELARRGSLGREYALAHFSTEACLPRLITVMENTVKARVPCA